MPKKNPFISGILSVIFPGAGQLYNEDFVKGIILIVSLIASIITIVYSGINLGTGIASGELTPDAGEIAKIVTASLLLAVIWIYGIIDAVVTAQRISAASIGGNSVTPPATRTREGAVGLGVVLLVIGAVALLLQMGLKFDYLVRYGLPVALILLGGYLLAKSTGMIKGGDPE